MNILIISICLALSYQDIKYRLIYSPLNCLLLLFGLFISNNTIYRIFGITLIPIILLLINKYIKEIIGDGDIEFISASGLILGFYKQNIMLLMSTILALIYILITKKRIVPMIPFLSIGLIICLLF